jgi:predicted RNA-binding Zn-ribbon protein involved in translation (DUF1610 family)
MSEGLAPKKKAARKKKAVAPKVEVQETVVTQTTEQVEVKTVRYKCIECGNEQGVKRCLRCGGHIVREV